jgi:hypothetical protein
MMDKKKAIEILTSAKGSDFYTTDFQDAILCAVDALRGNWKDATIEEPEQYSHVIIWDAENQAIGEAYWDGHYFHWVCDDEIANTNLWKEYEPPINM